MYLRFYWIVLLSGIVSAPSMALASKQTKPPKILYPERHIKFQAGNMGHKPWDHFVSYTPKANFNAAVFNKLLNVDSEYNLKPGLIKSWHWDSRENYYDLTIDTSAVFDKQRRLRPVDVEFAILKHFISTVSETDKRLFYDILGIEKLSPGMQFKSNMSTGVKTIGSDKLRIYLKSVNPEFLYSLGDIVSPIAPVEDFKEDLFSFSRIPRGTGPYKVVWSDPKSSLIRLQRKNLELAKKKDRSPLTIDFFNEGDIASNKINIVTGGLAKALVDNKLFQTIKGPMPIGIAVMDFNYSNSLASNIDFRRVVSLSINRGEHAAISPFRTAHHEMIPDQYYGRSGLKFEYNPEKAKKIVKEKFKSVSSKEKPLIGMYHGDEKTPKPKSALLIEKHLEEVGIYINLLPDDGVYFKGKFKDAVLSTYGSVSSFADPLVCFANYLPGTSSPENTDLKDKKAVELYERIKKSKSKEKKHELVKSLSTHFHKEIRQLPLAQIFQAYAFDKKVKNLNLDKSILVLDFTSVELVE